MKKGSPNTTALATALAAASIGPGDEVITTSFSFIASATCALMVNAVPIFADIDPNTYCIDPMNVKDKISDKTKAIIVVHLYGHPADMDAIMEISRKHDLTVIGDCPQAHGARYKGKIVGSIGHLGVWSFYQSKNMMTGEGGMVVTDDDELARRARLYRTFGSPTASFAPKPPLMLQGPQLKPF